MHLRILLSGWALLLACSEPQDFWASTRPSGARSALTVVEAAWGARRGAVNLEPGRPDALLDLEVEGPSQVAILYLDTPLEELALAEPPVKPEEGDVLVPLADSFLSGLQFTYREGTFGEVLEVSPPDLARFPFRALAAPCPWYTVHFSARALQPQEATVVGLVAAPEWGRFVAVEGNGRVLYFDESGTVQKELHLRVGATAAAFGAWNPGPNHLLVATSTGTLIELGPEGEELAVEQVSPVALTGVAYGTLAGLDRTLLVDARGWVYGRYPVGDFEARPAVPFARETSWKAVVAVGDDGVIYSEDYGAFRVVGNRLALVDELTPGPQHRVLTAAFSESLGMFAVVGFPRNQPEERYYLRQKLPDGSAWFDYPLTSHDNDVRSVVPGEQGWMIAGALGLRAGMVGLLEELRPQSRCRSLESTLRHEWVARVRETDLERRRRDHHRPERLLFAQPLRAPLGLRTATRSAERRPRLRRGRTRSARAAGTSSGRGQPSPLGGRR